MQRTRGRRAAAARFPGRRNRRRISTRLCAHLKSAGIEYHVEPHLVRGLDYYTRTVFEWTTDALGSQSTVCAGGRYDGLVEQLGGTSTPGIGWAMGQERIVMLLEKQGLGRAARPAAGLPGVGRRADRDPGLSAGGAAARRVAGSVKLQINLGRRQFQDAIQARRQERRASSRSCSGTTRWRAESLRVEAPAPGRGARRMPHRTNQ